MKFLSSGFKESQEISAKRGLLRMPLQVWQVTSVAVLSGNVKGLQSDVCLSFKREHYLYAIAPSCFMHLLLPRQLTNVTFTNIVLSTSVDYNDFFFFFFHFGRIFSQYLFTKFAPYSTLNSFSRWNETTDQKWLKENEVFISEELFVKCKKTKRWRHFFFLILIIYFEGHAENPA